MNKFRLTTPVDFFWTDLGIMGGTSNADGEAKKYGWLEDEILDQRKELYVKNNG
jgi:hypothetical protein